MPHSINGTSLSPRAAFWMRGTREANVLHSFPKAINLVNHADQVMSIVVPVIGNGPFSLVVNVDRLNGLVQGDHLVLVQDNRINFPEHVIGVGSARSWDPVPEWERAAGVDKELIVREIESQLYLADRSEGIAHLFSAFGADKQRKDIFDSRMRAGASLVMEGLETNDRAGLSAGARILGGLGVGLTPAGDDFLMGVMYGLRMIKGQEEAEDLCTVILNAAAGRTTRLSTAWLEAAQQGEAGEKWHHLVLAIGREDNSSVSEGIEAILQTGETSGADALSGFVQVLKMEQGR